MDLGIFTIDSWAFTWIILPLLIILARIADQSIGTLRLIFISKGYKTLAPVLGFFEVIIWLLAVSQILRHLDNVLTYIAYGLGFALGNYIGILIEQKLSLGNVIIRIIPKFDTTELVNQLREHNVGLTTVDAMGSRGPVKVIFSIIKRRDIDQVISIVHDYSPNAFYTIEEVKAVHEGIMPSDKRRSIIRPLWGDTKKSK